MMRHAAPACVSPAARGEAYCNTQDSRTHMENIGYNLCGSSGQCGGTIPPRLVLVGGNGAEASQRRDERESEDARHFWKLWSPDDEITMKTVQMSRNRCHLCRRRAPGTSVPGTGPGSIENRTRIARGPRSSPVRVRTFMSICCNIKNNTSVCAMFRVR